MKHLNRSSLQLPEKKPIRILQFGEGNFLRAFIDWMIDILNEKANYDSGVVIVQPIANGMVENLNTQDGLYHTLLRGLSNGIEVDTSRLISCVQQTINPFHDQAAFFEQARNEELQLVFSNTTEAGIEFDREDLLKPDILAKTFPAKLTQFLYERYSYFNGGFDSGLGIIPCELIDKNGEKLKRCVLQYAALWQLPQEFIDWIEQSNYFANTLVDRIVPGYPKDEIDNIQKQLGFNDQMVVTGEVFHLMVIEGPDKFQELFPAHLHGLNVKFVDDLAPYRTRKVRILNGAHTVMVSVGLLAGVETVKQTVEHPVIGKFVNDLVFQEVLPTIDLPADELNEFANDVMERFRNPFIRHELKSIALNSISKFKVRVLPTILDFINDNLYAPPNLCLAFASLVKLYLEGGSETYGFKDDQRHLDYFSRLNHDWNSDELVLKVLSDQSLWGQDLAKNQLLVSAVKKSFRNLVKTSIKEAIENRVKNSDESSNNH